MSESGEMRALKMIAKHGKAVVSRSTSEPGQINAGRHNLNHPTVAVAALVFLDQYPTNYVKIEKVGSRRWATLTQHGRDFLRSVHGITAAEASDE